MSTILLIIVMEAFKRLLEKARELELVMRVKVGRGDRKIEVSHLFFANDTKILCQPNERVMFYL